LNAAREGFAAASCGGVTGGMGRRLMPTDKIVLRMRGIAKRYGSVTALHGVDFTLARGEVMALLGENGAGKSTLVKILAGLERPDSGTIEIDGQPVRLRSTGQALHAGVAYVTQELSIIAPLSVAENIFLGGAGGAPIWTGRALAHRARPYLDLVGLGHLDPAVPAGSLPLAQQQLVEIARLLSRNAQILILDEPTAALSDAEIEMVKSVVRRLATEGRSIIYVTHRLGEVFEIANRVTIFRNGRSFEPVEVANLDIDELIEHLLGRRLEQMFPHRGETRGEIVLALRDVTGPGLRRPVSLDVHTGEILGLAGQLGSGANSVLRAIAGVVPRNGGAITLRGRPLDPRTVRDAIGVGIAYCSDDRKLDGIFAVRNLYENLTSAALPRITVAGLLSRRREVRLATELARFFEVSLDRLDSLAGKLSGGNQQKVALGKWLGIEPAILLVEEPTRGVDVGARAEIYRHLRALANQGLCIVFASSDNQEVLGLADSIATFFRGRLVRVADAVAFKPEELLRDVTHPDEAEIRGAA
jgi:ABC-type sugar transport system ATPase subunit